MATGGARVRSGRPPDALNGRADWITLDAAGRTGKAPRWPLTVASTRERAIWRRLWALPQAIEWERTHQELTVATYTRTLARAEIDDAPVGLLGLVKQMGDTLGLTSPGMRANRWRIGTVDAAPKVVPRRTRSRDRLHVVAAEALTDDSGDTDA